MNKERAEELGFKTLVNNEDYKRFEIGDNFCGKVEVSEDKGKLQISGASFKFWTEDEVKDFIKNLEKSIELASS